MLTALFVLGFDLETVELVVATVAVVGGAISPGAGDSITGDSVALVGTSGDYAAAPGAESARPAWFR